MKKETRLHEEDSPKIRESEKQEIQNEEDFNPLPSSTQVRGGVMVNMGYGNLVHGKKITALLKPGSSPMRRLVQEAREDKKLIDATQGKKTRTVIVMDNGYIILSAVLPETLAGKL